MEFASEEDWILEGVRLRNYAAKHQVENRYKVHWSTMISNQFKENLCGESSTSRYSKNRTACLPLVFLWRRFCMN